MAIRKSLHLKSIPLLWIFLAWLAFVFLTGGSARGDTTSLLVLRPLAILVCAALVFTMPRDLPGQNKSLLVMTAATIGLVALHLVPLPPGVWQSLPQRELIAEIDRAVGAVGTWRSLSVAPETTWNALYSLAIPLSIVLFMIRFPPKQRRTMALPILVLGSACALLGVLQISAGDNSALYTYRLSNFGSPVGLFANRNHTGAFMALMLPWLAVFSSYRGEDDDRHRFRMWIAAVATPVVMLFLLLLGSRAGLILGFLGLLSMPILYHGATARSRSWKVRLGVIAGVIVSTAIIAVIAISASRAESLDRLLSSDEAEGYRLTTFMPILRLAGEYMPFGSGIGSFVETYQRSEPLEMLEPRYFNHAHNDVLEVILTGGIPAILLSAFFAFFIARAAWQAFIGTSASNRDAQIVKAAVVSLALLFVASVVDYPLRTPAILGFSAMMFAMVMTRAEPKRSQTGWNKTS